MKTRVRVFLKTIKTQGRYAQNTILGYQNDLQHFLRYLHQHLGRPPGITDFNVKQVITYLKSGNQKYKANTVKRRLATLKQFARFLQLTGEIKAFQFPTTEQISSPNVDASQPRKISLLSDAQIASLSTALKADPRPQARRDEAIIELILEVGITASRLVDLNLADFKPSKSELRLQRISGEKWWFNLKNNGPILTQYLLEGRPELNPAPGETALFISQMGKRVSRQGVWQICQRWGERIGFSEGLSPRVLRYTAVFLMDQAGYSAPSIQEILGHCHPEATQGLLERIFEA